MLTTSCRSSGTSSARATISPRRSPTRPRGQNLMERVAFGSTDTDIISTLAGRLAKLSRRLGKPEREQLEWASGGTSLEVLSGSLVQALDPDVQEEIARQKHSLAPDVKPSEE